MALRLLAGGLLALASLGQDGPGVIADAPMVCDQCETWNAPQQPFRVFGNTYYVGTAGLSAVLVVSDDGLVLLDGALPQSAPLIDKNIRSLGVRTDNVRLILNSHAHVDHAGGIAAIQRATGAVVASSASGARALEQGRPLPEDPQAGSGDFPPVRNVRIVGDREVLRVGPIAITGFRFSGDATHPSRVESFRQSIAKVAALPCDVLLSVHPEFVQIPQKLAVRAKQPQTNPFVDANACREYAAAASSSLDRRITDER